MFATRQTNRAASKGRRRPKRYGKVYQGPRRNQPSKPKPTPVVQAICACGNLAKKNSKKCRPCKTGKATENGPAIRSGEYVIHPGTDVLVKGFYDPKWEPYRTEETLTFTLGTKWEPNMLVFKFKDSHIKAKMVNVYGSWRDRQWEDYKRAVKLEESPLRGI